MSGRFYATLPCPRSFAKVKPAVMSSLECFFFVSFFGQIPSCVYSVVPWILTSALFVCALSISNVSITPLGQGVNSVRLVSMATL